MVQILSIWGNNQQHNGNDDENQHYCYPTDIMNHHNFVSDKYDNNEMDLERGDSNMMITEYNTNDYDDHGDDQTVIPNERFEEDYDDDGDDDGNKNSSRSSYSWQDLPPPRQETAWEDESSYDYFFRRIRPSDRRSIQELHETWFPVNYQTEFYDELVHGRMCHTGDELYTNLIVSKEDPSELRACIVAAVVPANRLNRSSRQLLLPSSYPTPPSTSYPHQSPMIPPHALPPRRRQRQPMHCRACYIMTLGTVHKYRQAGLATQLIEQCYKEIIENDPQCGALYLHVITTNPSAIRFYERLGFWRVQEIPDYYYIEEQYYNCYLYAKYFHGNRGHLDIFKVLSWWISSVWNKIIKQPLKYLVHNSSSSLSMSSPLSSSLSPSSSSWSTTLSFSDRTDWTYNNNKHQ